MRHGANAMDVIRHVKERLNAIGPTLPEGVKIVTTYDRSELIARSIKTLKHELVLEMLIVSLIILIFLWHIPSAIIPIVTIPAAVLLSFIPMKMFGISSNIMSLGGIAVAIGALVDAAVVVVENAHKKLEIWEREGRKGRLQGDPDRGDPGGRTSELLLPARHRRLLHADLRPRGSGRAAVSAAGFHEELRDGDRSGARDHARPRDPAAVHPAEELRLPASLALPGRRTRSWSARCTRKRSIPSRAFSSGSTILRSEFVLRHPRLVIALAILIVLATIPAYKRLGSEFMPPLNEGSILYMPTTLPGISVTQAQSLLRRQDQILRKFPEVERVFGKAGRAETSTDPAPFSMMETVVTLKPESEWRTRDRWYSRRLPGFVKPFLRPLWPETISGDELVNEMNESLQLPGQTNAWTMPIKNRIDMLTTGIRTPVGVKVFGSDLNEIETIGRRLEEILRKVPGTRSVYGERVAGGFFVDFELKRREIARYGLTIKEVQEVIMTAIGGENVTTTIEGRERYPVNVRYPRELRDEPDKLARVLVPTRSGAQVPLSQLADIRLVEGPSMIRDENGRLSGYVYVDVDTAKRDLGGYIEDAKAAVLRSVKLPTGYTLVWSGQYEAMARVREKMKVVLPVTLFLDLRAALREHEVDRRRRCIVLLAVPFSAVGAVWFLYALGYHMSIGVWVGLIALLGLDAETGVFMLLYLDLAFEERKAAGAMRTRHDLEEAILHGAVRRVRPKVMTVACAFFGLVPIMWSTERAPTS